MTAIKLFGDKKVRSVWDEENKKWHFVVADAVAILTESPDPKDYIKKMRLRDLELGRAWDTLCTTQLMETEGGRQRLQCTDAKGLLRIIQAIPSPRAEPFKLWLAQVGSDRLDEIENPELATQRIRETYRAKGYSDEWIERRMRGIAVRDELTGEWQKRGVKEGKEYAILTAEISKATFGMTPSEYKALKRLDRPDENLRDHMSDLELIFTMLGEASTTEIARKRDAKGFDKNKRAAVEGGTVAGNARRELEQRSGRRVTSADNFKTLSERKKRQLKKNNE